MLGHSSLSEYALSEFVTVAVAPEPEPPSSGDIILRPIPAGHDICLWEPTETDDCTEPAVQTGGGRLPRRTAKKKPKRKKRVPVEIPDDVEVEVELWLDPVVDPPIQPLPPTPVEPVEVPVAREPEQPVALQPDPPQAEPTRRTRTRERITMRPRIHRTAPPKEERRLRHDEAEALAIILSLL